MWRTASQRRTARPRAADPCGTWSPLNSSAYSEMRPRLTFLSSLTQSIFSWLMPSAIVNEAAGIGQGDGVAAEMQDLFHRVDGHVA